METVCVLIVLYIIALFLLFPYGGGWVEKFYYLILVMAFPVLGLIVYVLIFRRG